MATKRTTRANRHPSAQAPVVSLHHIRIGLINAGVGQDNKSLLEYIKKDAALFATAQEVQIAGSTYRTYDRKEATRFITEFVQKKLAARAALEKPTAAPHADPVHLKRIEDKLDRLLALWDQQPSHAHV